MKLKSKQRKDIWVYYYYITFLFYTISLFTNTIQVGVMAAVYMIIILVELLRRKLILKFKADLVVLFYILYCIGSVLWFPRQILPINVYLTEIVYSILPICFYFVKNVDDSDERFINNTMQAIYYSLIVGLVLYEWAPGFYGDYLVYHTLSSNNARGWIQQAVQSFYGVTAVGTFSTIAVFYTFMQIINQNKTKDKILFILSIVALFLSGRRSAWLAVAVVLIYFHYLLYFKWHKLRIGHFIIEIGLVIITIILMNTVFLKQLDLLMNRISMMGLAFGERSGNWITGLQNVNNIFIGNGLGSMNHLSRLYSDIEGVYDSSYIKMFCEVGIIGTFLFALIIIRSIVNGMKNVEKYYIELGIILVFMIQAIGSNVFEFQVLTPIFWYAVGKCTKKNRRV